MLGILGAEGLDGGIPIGDGGAEVGQLPLGGMDRIRHAVPAAAVAEDAGEERWLVFFPGDRRGRGRGGRGRGRSDRSSGRGRIRSHCAAAIGADRARPEGGGEDEKREEAGFHAVGRDGSVGVNIASTVKGRAWRRGTPRTWGWRRSRPCQGARGGPPMPGPAWRRGRGRGGRTSTL